MQSWCSRGVEAPVPVSGAASTWAVCSTHVACLPSTLQAEAATEAGARREQPAARQVSEQGAALRLVIPCLPLLPDPPDHPASGPLVCMLLAMLVKLPVDPSSLPAWHAQARRWPHCSTEAQPPALPPCSTRLPAIALCAPLQVCRRFRHAAQAPAAAHQRCFGPTLHPAAPPAGRWADSPHACMHEYCTCSGHARHPGWYACTHDHPRASVRC